MRLAFTLPLLTLAAACNFENDSANDQMRVEYNQQRIEDAASKTARTAQEVGSAAGNVAVTTGRAIRNEVGDVDVDVDVSRNRTDRAGNEAAPR